ncbi:2Fe-2S iron-sulfur cluster-binding protein [Vannielia litorea]|uniref:2Fe-2S iron-sulfur cluster-binding protein n=1 Tax=Vannielia litorea TaxID=1217970 RepID=UPI001C940F66|nr:2Fe-2S iron-sulfur cluster-binding protein [Vannielia litorea]MBY6046805.1 2Fe-2S iron-sulfur cluster binding domain-containing protein [Vannielia litorea]MBY6074219.1 2Fe-2S iron-sulfur cluster binding domain-containing protein [Vannielia litorea]
MAQFLPLTVTDVRPTTREAVVVTLQPDDPEAFAFTQGQYLTFRQEIDGTEIRRSYSICCGVGEGLQVGIKRVEGGAFSSWANDNLKPGMRLEAMPPSGRFFVTLGEAPKHYLAFAGGSGITPVLSLIRTTLAAEPQSRFTLVYANRAAATVMFREELEDLKNRHMGRFRVIHVLEHDGQEVPLFSGRVDGEKVAALFGGLIEPEGVDVAFICGPEPMMLAISEALKAAGLSGDQIRFELFKSDQPGRLPQRVVAALAEGAKGAEAKVTLDGVTRTLTVEPGQTVLEAGLAASMEVPFSCRAGVCSTCRCRVLEGEVEMAANYALEDDEVAKGYVLSCQSHVISERVVVSYDE